MPAGTPRLFCWQAASIDGMRPPMIIVTANSADDARALVRIALEMHAEEHPEHQEIVEEMMTQFDEFPRIGGLCGGVYQHHPQVIIIEGDDFDEI